jgi:hypothetical protein
MALFKTVASYSWITAYGPINILTEKNDPEISLFGRKAGVSARKNGILFWFILVFRRLFVLQAVDGHKHASF